MTTLLNSAKSIDAGAGSGGAISSFVIGEYGSYLVVFVSALCSSVKINGTDMTLISSKTSPPLQAWGISGYAPGTYSIAATYKSVSRAGMYAYLFRQVGVAEYANKISGISTLSSLSVTPNENSDMYVDFVYLSYREASPITLSPHASQTSPQAESYISSFGEYYATLEGSYKASSVATNMLWTFGASSSFSHICLRLLPAAPVLGRGYILQ